MGAGRRVERRSKGYEPFVLPLDEPAMKVVEAAGIEPAFSVLQTDVSPLSLNLRKWQEQKDSNLRHAGLEAAVLAAELCS